MINPIIVNILVRKISTKEINPKTNEPFKIDDILIEEYRPEVLKRLEQLS